MTEINVVNLSAIIDIKYEIVLFDKQEPKKILLTLPYSDLVNLSTGYKNFDLKVFFEKSNYWISPRIFNKMKKAKPGIELDQIGIDVKLDQRKAFLKNNILRLIDRKIPVLLIEELAPGQKIDQKLIDNVKKILKEKQYVLHGTIARQIEEVSDSSADFLLQMLVGKEIRNKKFSDKNVPQFDKIFYYDNNSDIINFLKKINVVLENKMKKSKLADQIHEFINGNDLELELNKISNNEINPLSKKLVKIGLPRKFVKTFESWQDDLL